MLVGSRGNKQVPVVVFVFNEVSEREFGSLFYLKEAREAHHSIGNTRWKACKNQDPDIWKLKKFGISLHRTVIVLAQQIFMREFAADVVSPVFLPSLCIRPQRVKSEQSKNFIGPIPTTFYPYGAS